MHIDALSVLCAQLTRGLLAIAKFLLLYANILDFRESSFCWVYYLKFSFKLFSVSRNYTRK